LLDLDAYRREAPTMSLTNLAVLPAFFLLACGKAPEIGATTASPPDAVQPATPDTTQAAPPELAAPAAPLQVGATEATDDASTAPDAPFPLFTDEAGAFRIRAPGAPKTTPQEADTALGKLTYTNHMFLLPDDRGMLMIAWADMPLDDEELTPQRRADMFNGGRDGMLEATKAKLLTEREVTTSGQVGRDYLFELQVEGMGTVHNHVRSFLVGRRHFTLQAMRLSGTPKDAPLAFLDSLEFIAPLK
jgi:hypothetical protein